MKPRVCSKCGRDAVYHRAYSGESLCPPCFNSSIIEKARRTVSKYRLLEHGDRVAVAVSGGKDSLSLLHIMSGLAKQHGSQLLALTVDEGIAGYRDEAVDFSRKLTSEFGVPLTVVSFEGLYGFTLDEALKLRGSKKFSSCSICGVLRRRAIDVAARRVEANVVATAHNLDDVVQTFFISLLSGDLERLRWLDPTLRPRSEFAVRRIKPLMEVYEEELAFYAYLNGLPFQSVSCPYMEEGIRSEIRSVLNSLEARHPGIKYIALRTVVEVSQSLEIKAERSLGMCSICNQPSSSSICSVCSTLSLIRKEEKLNTSYMP